MKFVLSVAAIVALCFAIAYTNHEAWLTGWFLLLFFGALPMFMLAWVEMGRSLRGYSPRSRSTYILGALFGVPQAFFGLLALVSGVAIIAWVLYNSFVSRQPQYTGGFLTLGIGPALVLFGVYWIRDAFSRHEISTEAQQDIADHDEL